MDESIGSSMEYSADDTYETETDAAPDISSDEILDTAGDIAEDVPADIPEDVLDDLPLDIPEDLPEDVPEDFPEDGLARVLKRDEMDLLNSGNAAINDRLEVQADEYRDQGLSEDEIADRIAADRWRFQQEFLNDAFPGQDVSPNVFNAFSENGARDRIKDFESSPFLQEELRQEDAGEIPVPEEVPAPAPDIEFLDAEEEPSSEEAPVDAQDTALDEIPEDIADDYQVQTDADEVDDTGNLPSDMDEIPEDTADEMVDDTAEEPARDVPLSFEEDAEGEEWEPADDGYYHAIPRSEIPIVQEDGTVKSLEEVQQELETKEPYHAIPNSELDRSLTGEDTDTGSEAPETLPDQTDTVLPDLEMSDSIASEMSEDSGDIQPEDTLPDATPESFDREVPVAADIKSVDDVSGWLGDINPNFDAFDPESPYCNNCGSCAYAVYQRLEESTDSCASADNIGYNRDMEALTGMEQVSMSPDEIRDRLLAEGDGAHAIIGIDRAEGPGHWFNAACMDGKVVAIDGQTGEITDWPPDYGDVVNWEMSIRRGDK